MAFIPMNPDRRGPRRIRAWSENYRARLHPESQDRSARNPALAEAVKDDAVRSTDVEVESVPEQGALLRPEATTRKAR